MANFNARKKWLAKASEERIDCGCQIWITRQSTAPNLDKLVIGFHVQTNGALNRRPDFPEVFEFYGHEHNSNMRR